MCKEQGFGSNWIQNVTLWTPEILKTQYLKSKCIINFTVRLTLRLN